MNIHIVSLVIDQVLIKQAEECACRPVQHPYFGLDSRPVPTTDVKGDQGITLSKDDEPSGADRTSAQTPDKHK